MKGGFGNMMKQVQELQTNMQKVQEELAAMELTGEAGAGMVSVLMTGRYDVKRVNIDPKLLSEDKEMVEDLVAAAVNDAVRKVEKCSQEKFAAVTGGLNLPSGFKMPF